MKNEILKQHTREAHTRNESPYKLTHTQTNVHTNEATLFTTLLNSQLSRKVFLSRIRCMCALIVYNLCLCVTVYWRHMCCMYFQPERSLIHRWTNGFFVWAILLFSSLHSIVQVIERPELCNQFDTLYYDRFDALKKKTDFFLFHTEAHILTHRSIAQMHKHTYTALMIPIIEFTTWIETQKENYNAHTTSKDWQFPNYRRHT